MTIKVTTQADFGSLTFDTLMEDLVGRYERDLFEIVSKYPPGDPLGDSKIAYAERALKIVHQLRKNAKMEVIP